MNTSSNSREQKQQMINLAIKEYLNTPENLRSLTKVGEKYGVKRQTLSKHLKQLGFEVINYQNRVRVNEKAFDNINTEEQYYWLGFMYADGNISSTGNRLEMMLSIKDLAHLEKFRTFLKLETEIRTEICNGKEFCRLSVRNKHLWETLNSYGCTPRKSLTLEFPNIKILNNNKINVVHFIRGYVDGDGCLCHYKNSKNQIRTEISIVGTEKFLKTIKYIFGNKYGYIHNKSCTNWENKAYSLSFMGMIARKVARYLYEKATVYLDRKYEKYLYFCRLEEESSLRKSSKIGEGWDANTEITSKMAKGLEVLQSVEIE